MGDEQAVESVIAANCYNAVMNIHQFFIGKAVGFIAVLVIGGIGYAIWQLSAGDVSPSGSQATSTQSATQEDSAFTGSFADLAARGGEWKCTVDATANNGAGTAVSAGTVYISGKKVRADFATSVPGVGNVEAHLIADGTDTYSWSSMLPQGIKTKMTGSSADFSAPTSGGGSDANQRYTYDCQPAQAASSLFVPPADVTFRTL
jgi:hypothetical protein